MPQVRLLTAHLHDVGTEQNRVSTEQAYTACLHKGGAGGGGGIFIRITSVIHLRYKILADRSWLGIRGYSALKDKCDTSCFRAAISATRVSEREGQRRVPQPTRRALKMGLTHKLRCSSAAGSQYLASTVFRKENKKLSSLSPT